MLKLSGITKVYQTGDLRVEAVKDVNLNFERGEFVAILGPSGCGKTTLLNVIGGLDRYTSGDLVINGKSTKAYTERDMDAYRNHSVGFVFQSYNLIPHQSVLANVELALTLSGVGSKERRARAQEALNKVGLHDQMHKRPSQLSGGQMQRVAIARALVNEPDVLLADEPTGALDSTTSVQVMDLLKNLAKDRLVIMVTHNRELAEQYATRLIELKDGQVVLDSKPNEAKALPASQDSFKKTSMGFQTALSLSLNNLLTKRGRTLITAFAGSIGIIGIALILALSNGMNEYIVNIQKDTMVSYPITLQQETMQVSGFMEAMQEFHEEKQVQEKDGVYITPETTGPGGRFAAHMVKNNLTAFKQYLEQKDNPFLPYLSDVRYDYNTRFSIYSKDPSGEIIPLNQDKGNEMFSSFGFMSPNLASQLTELVPASTNGLVGDAVKDKYTLLAGHWPQDASEVIIILNNDNELDEAFLYSLGLYNISEYRERLSGARPALSGMKLAYQDLLGLQLSWLAPSDMYIEGEQGQFVDLSMDHTALSALVADAPKLTTVGIVRVSDEKSAQESALGYTRALSDQVIARGAQSVVIKAQQAQTEKDVVSGLWFAPKSEAQKAANTRILAEKMSPGDKALFAQRLFQMMPELAPKEPLGEGESDSSLPEGADMAQMMALMQSFLSGAQPQSGGFSGLPQDMLSQFTRNPGGGDAQMAVFVDSFLKTADEKTLAKMYDELLSAQATTHQAALLALGAVDKDLPSSISLYMDSFEDKEKVAALINEYNQTAGEGNQLSYVDYLAVMISGVTTIINAISYVLIAFVAVSLVVSSIMIGIITYISVLERIKEIGILRAVGASRKDVRRVFTAEAFIIGLAAGLLGILISFLLTFPINAVIFALTKDASIKAILPVSGAVILVGISALLSLLAGWLPSRIAAKKDPVEALRAE